MIASDQTGHAILEQLLDDHMARRIQDRLEPQHQIEIIVFQLPLGKRRFRSFDVDVDAGRYSRDALDERWNDQKIHIVGRRDDEAPRACRRDELFFGVEQIPYVAKDGLDRADQGERPVRRFHAGRRFDEQRVVQLLPQALQNVAHRRLTDEHVLRRARDVLLLHEQIEGDQQIEIEIS